MIIEALLWLVLCYIVCLVVTYGYAVYKNYQFLGIWNFKIQIGYVGVIKLPKMLTFWMGKRISG